MLRKLAQETRGDGDGKRTDLDESQGEVGQGRQRPASDVHIRLDIDVLEAHLDFGEDDAHPVDALPELEKEAFVVLLRDAQQLGDDLLAILVAQVAHVDLFLRRPPVRPDVLHDGRAHAIVGRELLQRRPFQRLLVILLVPLRRRAREYVLAPGVRHIQNPGRIHLVEFKSLRY